MTFVSAVGSHTNIQNVIKYGKAAILLRHGVLYHYKYIFFF